jgi:outer membrane biosynthesis protein TonB
MRLRRPSGVPKQSIVAGATGTILVHGAFVAIIFLTAQARSNQPQLIYSVELVAAPRPTATRPAPAAAPTPPSPPKVEPKPTPKKTAPVPKPKTPPKVDPKTEPAPPAKTANQPVPGATPSTGTDVDNVRVESSLAFPFPEYLRNLTNEILRRWSRPAGAGALQAEVSFTIMRDGSVRDIKVVRTSRSFAFDLEAQGAVEQTAKDRAFGVLPKGWPSDILQVAFLFTPRNRQ